MTIDVIAEFDGVLSVIDFKTSDRNKPEEWIDNYFCQCLAYAIMYEEIVGEPIEQIVVMMAVENGDSEIYVRKAEDYVDPLINYIKVYTESLAA